MTTERATIKCEAVFSDDSLHRYSLSKIWDKTLPLANVITIAPSEDFNVTSDTTTSIICIIFICLEWAALYLQI